MKAVILNCTLKKSPEESNTQMLVDEVISNLEERGVECETVRLVDLNMRPASAPTRGTATSGRRSGKRSLTPTSSCSPPRPGSGILSSVAQRALERMDAMLSEQNEAGQMITYGRVAGFVVTGNEDGAHRIISQLAQGVIDCGEVVALHNHHLMEEPRLFYMHFWANDDAETLAEGLRAALDETNSA